MDSNSVETSVVSASSETVCGNEGYSSYSELIEAKWEELVIRFDKEKGRHVVLTACCPMAPVC